LSQEWNGSQWLSESPVQSSTTYNQLYSVSCTGSTFCMTVGSYISTSILVAMSQVWRGSSWSTVGTTDFSTTHNVLSGVSCPSSSACVAVGYYTSGSETLTVAEQWTGGTSYSSASGAQNPSSTSNLLESVSCDSSSDCVAVGQAATPGDTPLIVSWTGSEWSLVAGPDPATQASALAGVSCTSLGGCTAVGAANEQTLALSGTTPVPKITSFSPASGKVGAKINIKGSGFLSLVGVKIGSKSASILSWTNTKITIEVPSGAKTGKIEVIADGGTATSATSFKVT